MRHRTRIRAAARRRDAARGPDEVIASFVGPYGLYLHVRSAGRSAPTVRTTRCSTARGRCRATSTPCARSSTVPRPRGASRRSTSAAEHRRSASRSSPPSLAWLDVEGERAIEVLPTHATPERSPSCTSSASTTSASASSRSTRHAAPSRPAEHRGGQPPRPAATGSSLRQRRPDLRRRIRRARRLPARFRGVLPSNVDQISTYPLMHFGFTPFGKAPHAPRAEHDLLRRACELAGRLGYERRSVWTFTRSAGRCTRRSRASSTSAAAQAPRRSRAGLPRQPFRPRAVRAALAEGRLPLARRAHLDPCARRSTTRSGSSTRRASTSTASGCSSRVPAGCCPSCSPPADRPPRARSRPSPAHRAGIRPLPRPRALGHLPPDRATVGGDASGASCAIARARGPPPSAVGDGSVAGSRAQGCAGQSHAADPADLVVPRAPRMRRR